MCPDNYTLLDRISDGKRAFFIEITHLLGSIERGAYASD